MLAVASLLIASLPACAVSGALDQQTTGEAAGAARLLLVFPVDLKLGKVVYEISGNDIAPIDGLMELSSASDSLAALVSLPSGQGYTLRVTTVVGVDIVGAKLVLCQASAMFDVETGGISEIAVQLECDDSEPQADGTSSSAELTGPDAGTKQRELDAGAHDSKDASASDAARSPGDGGRVPPGAVSNARGDAGTSIAAAPANPAPTNQLPSSATVGDAGAPAQPTVASCDACRFQVCTALGSNAQRIAQCFVASSDEWSAVTPATPSLGCRNPAQCVQLVCADACPPHP